MEKDDLRVRAVERNAVEDLAMLSDRTEWYKYINPDNGDTLLHVAVEYRRKEVFDYLLANVDVPMNCKNSQGRTVLDVCFYPFGWECGSADYFAYELIRRGASVDSVALKRGQTLLHLAISRKYVKVSKLLVNMGHELNGRDDQGLTAFWKCIDHIKQPEAYEPELVELVSDLLYNGADPTDYSSFAWSSYYNTFDEVVSCTSRKYHRLHELLFDFLIDDYTPIHFETILNLATSRSSLFRDAVERAKNVTVTNLNGSILYLFTIDADDLDLLIKKCAGAIRKAFADVEDVWIGENIWKKKFIENANMLLESDLRDDAIDFMSRFGGDVLIHCAPFEDESVALSFACFLLSYGLKLKEQHLIQFYKAYGYGKSFKILLHMEIETKCPKSNGPCTWAPFGLLLYDVNCDLRQILENSEEYSPHDVHQLIYYFSNAKLRALCDGSESAEIAAAIENQPNVPLLSELARNVFRKHLVKRFNVTKASQFYALVNGLPIPPAHKKIITLETKLY